MPMLFTVGGGLITELISLSLLYKAQKTNFNIKGAHWHVLQTFAGSPIIIVVTLTIWFTDFLETDPLLGMPFGLLLLGASWTIIRAALYILLDNVPRDLDLMNEAQSAIEAAHGVDSVHHLHAWSITQGKNILSAHVLVSNIREAEHTPQRIQAMLKPDFQMYFSTIQLESEVYAEIEKAEQVDFLRQQPDWI